ncbi:unnamed protein product [Caenorhabditis bovis]|uniref:Uncharacterized protein n=1 Tax=Caenorhabditis bovis TaxID=2654633 RepID=A0A8S1ECG7_9PELO|nr:unnamed protein product [Caenorhabditis bovis]
MATASVKSFFQRCSTSFKEYWKQLGNDYLTVAKDTFEGCKSKPVRSGFIFSGIAFMTYAYKTNPTEIDMLNYMCEKRQQLSEVPVSQYNPKTKAEMVRRDYLLNKDRLNYYNLWFFSLLVSSPSNNNLRIYSSQTPLLKDWPWNEFWNNIVDVGYLGTWKNLDAAFENFDINTDEIDQLPDDSSS